MRAKMITIDGAIAASMSPNGARARKGVAGKSAVVDGVEIAYTKRTGFAGASH